MEYDGLTVDELTAKLIERDTQIDLLTKSEETLTSGNSDLTAERDSLREELDELKATFAKQADELAETKKLNYRLGRTIGVDNRTQQEIEQETYIEAFKGIR